jgi:hypothetical protein
MSNLAHDDITVTLDELFANNKVAQLLPQDELLQTWRMLSEGSAKNINARGAFYMLQSRQPNNIRQKAFANSTAGQQFPEPTKSKYLTMNLTAIVDEATLQWDGNVDVQNDAALKQKPAKDLDYVENEMEGIYASYARDKARQIWGDRSNELARASAINTGTKTVTCNNAGNLFNVQLLEEGDIVEARDGSGTLLGYVQVDSVYRPTKTFIIAADYIKDSAGATTTLGSGGGQLNIVNGTRFYPKGGYNNGWPGVDYLIATSGAFQSISDRTIHDHLTGVQVDAAGRALSAALMRRLRSARRNRRYGVKSKGKFYASAQIDAYESTGWATQKYGQTTSLDMGYREDELKFDGKAFQWDYYVGKNKVYEADMSAIDRFELREFKPLRGENGYKYRAPGDDRHYDKENMYFKGIGTLGCEIPAAVGAF